MKKILHLLIGFSLAVGTSLHAQTNYDWAANSVAVSNLGGCVYATYTFSLTNNANANAAIRGFSCASGNGGTVSITFPAGTTFGYVTGSVNGTAFGAVTKAGTVLTFNVPGFACPFIASSAAFTIIINNVMNPAAGVYNPAFPANTVKVKNLTAGWDQHASGFGNLTFTACPTSPSTGGFQNVFGGMNTEEGGFGKQTTDGGYIILGTSNTYESGYGYYLTKTASDGAISWSKAYGGPDIDWALALDQTNDGGYVMAGYSYTYNGGPSGAADGFLVKANATGAYQWAVVFGGTDFEDYLQAVAKTADGGCIVAGHTYSLPANSMDIYLAKVSSTGAVSWEKTYDTQDATPASGLDDAFAVQQTTDGGYIVAGQTVSGLTVNAGYDLFLMKTDASGNIQWTNAYGGTNWELSYSVKQTTDGGYILGGETYTFGSGDEFYLLKVSANGTKQWAYAYGGTTIENGGFATQTTDGGYAIVGSTRSFGSPGSPTINTLLVRTDNAGTALWSKTYGGYNDERPAVVQPTADGGLVTMGYTFSAGAGNYDLFMTKSDGNGNTGCNEAAVGTLTTSSATAGTTTYNYITFSDIIPAGGIGTNTIAPATTGADAATTTTVVCSTPPPALPLRMISFTGRHTENGNVLEWVTGEEFNTDYFIVERSLNGRIFSPAGQIKASGNAGSGQYYFFADKGTSSFTGTCYYRLREADYDGRYTYSNTISISAGGNSRMVKVAPNPAGKNIFISGISLPAELQLLSPVGECLYKEYLKDVNPKVDISFLLPGIYFVKISSSAGELVQKLVVENPR